MTILPHIRRQHSDHHGSEGNHHPRQRGIRAHQRFRPRRADWQEPQRGAPPGHAACRLREPVADHQVG